MFNANNTRDRLNKRKTAYIEDEKRKELKGSTTSKHKQYEFQGSNCVGFPTDNISVIFIRMFSSFNRISFIFCYESMLSPLLSMSKCGGVKMEKNVNI